MPKSYLADEPGAQRAEQHRFDPYLQTWNRLDAYRQIGHPVDKVELIVLGGTWSRLSRALSDLVHAALLRRALRLRRGHRRRAQARRGAGAATASSPALDGRRARDAPTTRAIGAASAQRARARAQLHASERADWDELEAAQRRNESAALPLRRALLRDAAGSASTRTEVLRLRRLGATKIQLGIQSTDDALLARNRRGHDVAATRAALAGCAAPGIKLHAHWMANLLGATPESDAADYERLFSDPGAAARRAQALPVPAGRERAARGATTRAARGAPIRTTCSPTCSPHCLARTPRWCRAHARGARLLRRTTSSRARASPTCARWWSGASTRGACARRDIRSREVRGAAVDETTPRAARERLRHGGRRGALPRAV